MLERLFAEGALRWLPDPDSSLFTPPTPETGLDTGLTSPSGAFVFTGERG
jgi:hypothetical protein